MQTSSLNYADQTSSKFPPFFSGLLQWTPPPADSVSLPQITIASVCFILFFCDICSHMKLCCLKMALLLVLCVLPLT